MAPRQSGHKVTRPKGNGNGNRVTQPTRNRQHPLPINTQREIERKLYDKVDRLAGSEFISSIRVKAVPNSVADHILYSKIVGPSDYAGTRLSILSNLWERYKFRKFNLRYEPSIPTTLGCQLLAYVDTDPLDDPSIIPSRNSLIRQAMAQTGAKQFNFIARTVIPMAKRGDDQLYYTGAVKENQRFSSQGKLYIIQVTNPLDYNGKPLTEDIECGALYIDWEVDFHTPQLNPEAAAVISKFYQDGVDIRFTAGQTEKSFFLNRPGVINFSGLEAIASKFVLKLNTGVEIGLFEPTSASNTRLVCPQTILAAGTYSFIVTTNDPNAFTIGLSVSSVFEDIGIIEA